MKKKESKKEAAKKSAPSQNATLEESIAQALVTDQKRPNPLDGDLITLGNTVTSLLECKDDHAELLKALEAKETQRKDVTNKVIAKRKEQGVETKYQPSSLKDVIYILAIQAIEWKELQHGQHRGAAKLFSSLSSRLRPGSAEKPFSFESLHMYLTVCGALGHGDWAVLGFLDDFLEQHASSISPSDWVDPFIEKYIINFSANSETYRNDPDYKMQPKERLERSHRQLIAKHESIRSRVITQATHFDKAFDIITMDPPDESKSVAKKTLSPALTEKPWSPDEEVRCRTFIQEKLSHLPQVRSLWTLPTLSHFEPSPSAGI